MLRKTELKRHFGSNNKMRKFKESEFPSKLTLERW